MRLSKKKCYFIVVALVWLASMFCLIKQEYFPPSLEETEISYQNIFINLKDKKQTRMGVYFGKERIGEIHSIIIPQLDELNKTKFEIDTTFKLSIPLGEGVMAKQLQTLFNLPEVEDKKLDASFFTTLHIDSEYQVRDMKFRFASPSVNFTYEGKVKDNTLFLTRDQDGQKMIYEVPMPKGTMMGNNLGMVETFPKLKMGKKFPMRWFDVFSRKNRMALVEVIDEDPQYVWDKNSPPVHAYQVSMTFENFSSKVWVTEEGEMLEYRIWMLCFVKEPIHPKPSQETTQNSKQTQEK